MDAREGARRRHVAALTRWPVRTSLVCDHEWERVDDRFNQCRKVGCRVLFCYNPPHPKLKELPGWFAGRRLPPSIVHRGVSDQHGNKLTFNDFVVVDKRVLLRRQLDVEAKPWTIPRYYLVVRFPRLWLSSSLFTALNWEAIVAAVTPVLETRDPVAIYLAIQSVLLGRRWVDAQQLQQYL